jgi:hypothetical protein
VQEVRNVNGKILNVASRQFVVSFHSTGTCQGIVAGLFTGSWGGTRGSAASRPDMMFLSSALNATGLLTLLICIYVVNMEVWTEYINNVSYV